MRAVNAISLTRTRQVTPPKLIFIFMQGRGVAAAASRLSEPGPASYGASPFKNTTLTRMINILPRAHSARKNTNPNC